MTMCGPKTKLHRERSERASMIRFLLGILFGFVRGLFFTKNDF